MDPSLISHVKKNLNKNVKWEKSLDERYNINFYGLTHLKANVAGGGGLVRDHSNRCTGAYAVPIGNHSNNISEVRAML